MDEATRKHIREAARETVDVHHAISQDLIEAIRLTVELAAPHPWYFVLRTTLADGLRRLIPTAHMLSLAEVLEVLEAEES